MGSKVSISISAGSCINAQIYARIAIKPLGIILKRKQLEHWMCENGYSYYAIAREMRIHPRQLTRKLHKGKPFPEGQIRRLTFLLGAREMFFVIYFPTNRERRRVYRETFGCEPFEGKRRGRRQRIVWAKDQ